MDSRIRSPPAFGEECGMTAAPHPWGNSPDLCVIGGRGGRRSALNRRLRRLAAALDLESAPVPEPEANPETAHEASVLIDVRYPHLREAFARDGWGRPRNAPAAAGASASGGRRQRKDNRFVLLDGERLCLKDAARRLSVSMVALHFRLVNRTGDANYGCVDVREVGAD